MKIIAEILYRDNIIFTNKVSLNTLQKKKIPHIATMFAKEVIALKNISIRNQITKFFDDK